MESRLVTKKINNKYPTVGKIKVGMRDTEKGNPISLDYFRADCGQNKAYEELFKKAHGEKPSSIPIVFLSDDSTACRHYLTLRDKAGKALAEGDGLNFRVAVFDKELKISKWVDAPEEVILSEYDTIEAFMEAQVAKAGVDKYGKPMKWKEELCLRFLLPKVSELGLLGVWEFRTKAVESSIPQIVGYFDTIKEGAGTVKMLPFDLRVRKVKSDKSGSPQSYVVVDMVANVSAENIESIRRIAEKGSIGIGQGILTAQKIKELDQQQLPNNMHIAYPAGGKINLADEVRFMQNVLEHQGNKVVIAVNRAQNTRDGGVIFIPSFHVAHPAEGKINFENKEIFLKEVLQHEGHQVTITITKQSDDTLGNA